MVARRIKGYSKCCFNAAEITKICRLIKDKVIMCDGRRKSEGKNFILISKKESDMILLIFW